MRNKKRLISFLLISVLVTANFYMFSNNAVAAQNATIIIDGKQLVTDVAPQNINNRLLVPFRAIGEAMNAVANWDDPQKKVTMVLNDKYVIVYVGKSTMTYGKLSIGSGGNIVYETSNTMYLDAPPVNINSRVLVPLRAISEGLGASVNWIPANNSAYITSPPKPTATPTPTPSASPTPTPTATPNATAQTTYYQPISASRAQTMFDSRTQFVMVLFDSSRVNTTDILSLVKEVASETTLKIYGVDAYLESGSTIKPSFAANLLGNSLVTLSYPCVFYVQSPTKVKYNQSPTNKSQLTIEFEDFKYDTRPGATPTIDTSRYIQSIDSVSATTLKNNGTKFVLVYYDSTHVNYSYYMNIISDAVYNYATTNTGYAKTIVYSIDASSISDNSRPLKENTNFWPNNYYNAYPTVFFVNGSTSVYNVVEPNSSSDLANKLQNFSQNGTP